VEVEEGVRDDRGGDAAGALVGEREDDGERDEREEARETVVVGPVDVKGGEDDRGEQEGDRAGDARAEKAEQSGAEKKLLGNRSENDGEEDHETENDDGVGFRKNAEDILLPHRNPGPLEKFQRKEVRDGDDRSGDQKGGQPGQKILRNENASGRFLPGPGASEEETDDEADLECGGVEGVLNVSRELERARKKSHRKNAHEGDGDGDAHEQKKIRGGNLPAFEQGRVGSQPFAGGAGEHEAPEQDHAKRKEAELENEDGERRRIFWHARSTSAVENRPGRKRATAEGRSSVRRRDAGGRVRSGGVGA